MWIKLDLQGMHLDMKIEVPSYRDPEDWCIVNSVFVFRDIIGYEIANEELFMYEELIFLKNKIDMLLNGEIEKPTMLQFMEPDFRFMFCPRCDLRNDPDIAYVEEGHEYTDPHVEWNVYLWNEGLTTNCFTCVLNVDDLLILRDYLRLCLNEIDETDDIIMQYIDEGYMHTDYQIVDEQFDA